MLPSVWIAIGFFSFLYALLFFTQWRARTRSHVRRCPSLPYLSQASLDSLIIIEPDLVIVELMHPQASVTGRHIPDAHLVPVSILEAFLTGQDPRSVFVFYGAGNGMENWQEVERIVNEMRIPSVYVLRGGLEGWLRKHSGDQIPVPSQVSDEPFPSGKPGLPS
jgi:rhodanese-related sulfurtransferase